ncbi:hypothetical protein TBLA_0E01740 [Henningerozyma blattae CBS 6284]|uniref:Uncharacterized protein n=1 Tax=Henningerozyma blattae (strain ATCC 34711 / CBS 6284 / DSM 70876 / NBRC 10599 / NRRL Y-10934 / UCD 77-7) TaxID=1071380 RepID=I2H4C8_HENB6|nr:hypothetical protein TBLA_0E01740 [Tetrapisispora blattae CBS 6284]CCH61230.1 hypothetical protein TBLA_0E01740 [Tetrapisispora blattae CBS 6284]
MSQHRGILLTTPEGTGTAVQFDSEQIENDRGRSKKRFKDKTNTSRSATGGSSISRSRSRASSRVRDEEFLKWTVLRKDPSMRLILINGSDDKKNGSKDRGRSKNRENGDDNDPLSANNNDDDDNNDKEDELDADNESNLNLQQIKDALSLENEISDEEQVSDIENEAELDEEFQFEQGNKILPNFCTYINLTLEGGKKWIRNYESQVKGKENEGINLIKLDNGYARAIEGYSKGKGCSADGKSYLLYSDLSSESTYALAYLIGSIIKNGDMIYLVHWEGNNKKIPEKQLSDNVFRMRRHVLHLLDAASTIIDDAEIMMVSLTHPYPKHFLNELIHGLDISMLCCSLTMILSGLQNFVSSIPMLIVRKKLKKRIVQ